MLKDVNTNDKSLKKSCKLLVLKLNSFLTAIPTRSVLILSNTFYWDESEKLVNQAKFSIGQTYRIGARSTIVSSLKIECSANRLIGKIM